MKLTKIAIASNDVIKDTIVRFGKILLKDLSDDPKLREDVDTHKAGCIMLYEGVLNKSLDELNTTETISEYVNRSEYVIERLKYMFMHVHQEIEKQEKQEKDHPDFETNRFILDTLTILLDARIEEVLELSIQELIDEIDKSNATQEHLYINTNTNFNFGKERNHALN